MAERQPFAVEFDIAGDATCFWVEAEATELERLPELDGLQRRLGGADAIKPFLEIFRRHGGAWKEFRYECRCAKCAHAWTQSEAPTRGTLPGGCPSCGAPVTRENIAAQKLAYGFEITPEAGESPGSDNTRRGDIVRLPRPFEIVPAGSPTFFNWDQHASVEAYGGDDTRDVRFGPDGRLVQTREPVLRLRSAATHETRPLRVEHHSGRLVDETAERQPR